MTPADYRSAGDLFEQLRELPEGERAAALDAACAGNAELRAQVLRLLEADRDAAGGSFLERRAIEDAARLVASDGPKLPALSSGDRLGSYQILALIGKGGMGEVYRARDTRLGRDVAIKVLPSLLAQDPERLARFQREAKALATLNHSNIAAVYGFEDHAIVMELVEGPTLADRLKAGPLPLEETLAIARQVAEALEAAHERGVVHRDLKPANIKAPPDGSVKVLDFGLATIASASTDESQAEARTTDSPTLAMRTTEAGVILGTASYMSPEQASGKRVDKRADIWSFGVVLWEMLTGKPLFDGETVSHTLADVLQGEIDFKKLAASTSPPIRELLKRCLDRDLKMRLRDIGEARIAIQKYLADPVSGTEVQRRAEARPTRLLWALLGALLLIAVASSWSAWRATRPAGGPLLRLDVDLGPEVSPGSAVGAHAIISPDGRRLVYLSQSRLFTRRLDQPKATELAGTQGAYEPFFSPDGQWVAFFADNKLKKVSAEGGAAIALCDATPNARGGSWSEDGNIIVALANFGPLSRIPSAGGAATPVTFLTPGEVTHRWPQTLPGGKAVLFSANNAATEFDGANIEVVSLGDRRRKTLVRGGTYGHYLPSGHLVYINRGTLFAVPFDLDRLEIRGTSSPVLQEVEYNVEEGYAQLDFSKAPSGHGTLVYRNGGAQRAGLVTVQWLDGAGKTQPLLARPDAYLYPRLSPDGQRLALSTTDRLGGNLADNVWIYDWQRDALTRLTFGGRSNGAPVWSPDGRYIAFRKLAEGMFWTRSDGAGKPQPLTQSKNVQIPYSFTPDGKRLAFQERTSSTGIDLWTVPLESDRTGLRAGTPEVFLQTPFNERNPSFSSDGQWLAYASDESGEYQVYVRAFPDKGGRWQISNGGGLYPVFSRSGRELFFRTEDNRIMMAAYTVKGDSFVADKPRVWSEKIVANLGLNGANYDLTPEGKRIVALMPAEAPKEQLADNQVIFLQNFFDDVRRKAPVGK
jgi:Tol biopolymer transport system component/predicted Ser/Thr protein kinase